jgi:hypothetical protein
VSTYHGGRSPAAHDKVIAEVPERYQAGRQAEWAVHLRERREGYLPICSRYECSPWARMSRPGQGGP